MKKLNLFSLILLASLTTYSVANAETGKKKAKAQKPDAEKTEQSTSAKPAYSRPYGMAGCGLGHYVVGKNGSQILSSTTNGTLGNQTFGITFGTLDCEDSQKLAGTASRLDNFITANKVALASDAAKGEGETVSVLAKIMNCSDSAKLGSSLQNNFGTIFNRYDLTANEISDHVLSMVIADQALAQQCNVHI